MGILNRKRSMHTNVETAIDITYNINISQFYY